MATALREGEAFLAHVRDDLLERHGARLGRFYLIKLNLGKALDKHKEA